MRGNSKGIRLHAYTQYCQRSTVNHACVCHLDCDEDAITAARCRENKKRYFMLSTEVCK